MARPMLKTAALLAVVLIWVFVSVGLLVTDLVGGITNDFNMAVDRLTNNLQDGTAVYGLVPKMARNACKTFNCPIDQTAVQVPVSAQVSEISAHSSYCLCVLPAEASLIEALVEAVEYKKSGTTFSQRRQRRDRLREPVARDTNFTFVPPAKTDITGDLLAQSLAVQPQDTATVGSVMPHFKDVVISYGVQLNGLVAATMTLNASATLPCANIGAAGEPQPDLILRPKDIDYGMTQAYIPDCTIIAVNMYNPKYINYWVMNEAGSIFALVGSNKVVDIDKLNSTASTSLVLRAGPAGAVKRDIMTTAFDQAISIAKRALSAPNPHTASMSVEACAAMTCNNNGGKPAVFNPFTKTCWCRDPIYVETSSV